VAAVRSYMLIVEIREHWLGEMVVLRHEYPEEVVEVVLLHGT